MTVIMCMPVLARGRAPLLSSPLDHASGRQLGRNAHVGSVSCQRRQGRGRYAVVTAASSPAPVQRVAIVGGGIAGLSLAHALKCANAISRQLFLVSHAFERGQTADVHCASKLVSLLARPRARSRRAYHCV